MSSKPIRIPGIADSLRRESYNLAALRAAAALVPEGAILDTFEFDGIPVLNQDVDQNPPPKVSELKRRIREADAILFVTPKFVAARFSFPIPVQQNPESPLTASSLPQLFSAQAISPCYC
jgi:hypothetical protein